MKGETVSPSVVEYKNSMIDVLLAGSRRNVITKLVDENAVILVRHGRTTESAKYKYVHEALPRIIALQSNRLTSI
jgi:hypothetical protein